MHRARLVVCLVCASSLPAQAPPPLDNGTVRATFDARGLVSLHEPASGARLALAEDGFAVFADEAALESQFLTATVGEATATERSFRFVSGDWLVRVVYELRPGWAFVGKQVSVEKKGEREFRVHRLEAWRGQLAERPAQQVAIRGGVLLRSATPPGGAFFVLQNPFGQWRQEGVGFALGHAPEMASHERVFTGDRVCLGVHALRGRELPQQQLPEWRHVVDGALPTGPRLDDAEIDALVGCARAFLGWRPQRSTRVHIGWCENDYQIDVGTAAGRAEYERILDQAAAVGCGHVLFTPAHEALAPLADNKDAWGWENVLWLGLGQQIRKDTWLPGRDAIPATVEGLLDHMRQRGLRPLAYVYPTMPFLQQKRWTAWIDGEPGGYRGVDTGERSFQDWFVDKLVAFAQATGVGGYSFDHWWIAYDGASSRYAQWDGCRRVLQQLRARLPDAVIDGRQQYHGFGVWTWLAGSYPHPLASDEQPESFRSFPDLHWDRASADRQRRTAYAFRMQDFVPVEIMPGYLLHQTPRLDEKGQCPRERFRPRDFDLLGYRYSVLSAIATAPYQLVVNFLPARDEGEFRAFAGAERAWLRGWLDWADQHLEILRHTRPILGPVQLGLVDGNAACRGDRGFVFLFNPNYRVLPATFVLDAGLGLTEGEHFVLRQLYPDAEKGRLLAPPDGSTWRRGQSVAVAMPGAEAMVLQIEPVAPVPMAPRLMGAAGQAEVVGGELRLRDVVGEVGTDRTLRIALPQAERLKGCVVAGAPAAFTQVGDVVDVAVHFAGEPFARCQQVGGHDPAFAGGTFRGKAAVPAWVFAQLAARRAAWPVDYDADDLRAGYLGSHRLLLYVQVAEPDDEMRPILRVDGAVVPLQAAYSSIVRSNPKHTFVGWFADLSTLTADVEHTFEVDLPALRPGQFQGLFFDTVVTATTAVVQPR